MPDVETRTKDHPKVILSRRSEVDVVADQNFSVRVALEATPHIFAVVQLIEFFGVIVHDYVDLVTGFGVESNRIGFSHPNHLRRSFGLRSR